jgi:hypothetical protein
LLLAKRGAATCVNYAAHADAAEALVAEIIAAGGRAIAAQADAGFVFAYKNIRYGGWVAHAHYGVFDGSAIRLNHT